MAKKGEAVIIKKIKKAGHGAAHGGAWKVAYADFVTAMMCFFMVMWLMGSDEETKAAVAQYFNNPPSIFSAGNDEDSKAKVPMGEFSGEGEALLSGKEGAFPDELVQAPVRPVTEQRLTEHQELSELIKELMDGNAFAMKVTIDTIQFSVPSGMVFDSSDSKLTDRVKPEGKTYLDRLGRLVKGYNGNMAIEGHLDEASLSQIRTNAYEFTVSQAVAVMDHFVSKNFMAEERIIPRGAGTRRKLASSEPAPKATAHKENRIEFTLSRNSLD